MGIGGHKHHYNDAQIEKEMKGIGDTVCFDHSIRKDDEFFPSIE